MLTFEQGKHLVGLARRVVESRKVFSDKTVDDKTGVFVTIETFPEHELRGCVGFLDGVYPMGDAVQKVAMNAAFEDERFLPLEKNELDKVVFEVSVMTNPKLVEAKNYKEYLRKIKFGDGLIVECNGSRALYLPQVWEKIPELENFLDSLCMKCGLPHDSWKNIDKVKLLKFNVQTFKETKPNGKVVEVSTEHR